ncbi:MAG TPA: hypothetical protein VL200_07135 [Lacunisphaera sp.]|nr:hypothetical protein [Lacunisphaera sp.]
MNFAARKEPLVRACGADRAAWDFAFRRLSAAPPRAESINQLLDFVEPLAGLLPPRWRTWVRGGSMLLRFFFPREAGPEPAPADLRPAGS